MRGRLRHALYALFALFCLAAVSWPGYALFGNRVEPFVLGLPFLLVWNILWVALALTGLVVYHLTGRER